MRPVALALGIVLAGLSGCTEAPPPAANKNTSAPPPSAGKSEPGAPQEVNFTTDDGVMITGDLYLPEKSPAPAIIALHQWQSDRSAYASFAKGMRDAGFVVLAIDGRGFGGSTKSSEGTARQDWNTQEDIDAAVEYLKAQPSVDALRIGIVGASYGASNALIYAAENPQTIRSTVLLSAGLAYNPSIPTEPAMQKYGDRPILIVAAQDDEEAAKAAERLGQSKQKGQEVKIYPSGGHGTSLLAASVGGDKLVHDFLVSTLTGPIVSRGGEGDVDAEGGGSGPAGSSNENTQNDNSKGDNE